MPATDKLTLDALVQNLPRDLEALRAAAKATGKAGFLPLDLSYESLDRLEDYAKHALATASDLAAWKPHRDLQMRYLGATLIEHVKGTWGVGGDLSSGEPVVHVPGLKARPFRPFEPVASFRNHKTAGIFRDATERWDLRLRRAALAQLLAAKDRELDALRDDVREFSGERLAALDDSAKSMKALDDALFKLNTGDAPRARKRAVRQRAVLLLGTLLGNAVAGAEWSVCDKPDYTDFGHFTIGGWAPYHTVVVTTAKARAAGLRGALVEAIKDAKSAGKKKR